MGDIILYGWLISLPLALFLTMRYIGSKRRMIQDRHYSYANFFLTSASSAYAWAIIAGFVLLPLWPLTIIVIMGLESGRKADLKNQRLQERLQEEQELTRQLKAESAAAEAAHRAEIKKIMKEEGWDKVPGLPV